MALAYRRQQTAALWRAVELSDRLKLTGTRLILLQCCRPRPSLHFRHAPVVNDSDCVNLEKVIGSGKRCDTD
jgi:hypothetical protein